VRALTLLSGLTIALLVVAGLTIEEAEVVTLITHDTRGRPEKTGLWIVDADGQRYLRAASPRVSWLAHLRREPRAELTRQGHTESVLAFPVDDPAVRELVDRAMSRKYGTLDRVMAWLFDHSRAVPIRVESPEAHGGNGRPPDAP
jgi:hypothetical protein